MKNKQNNNGKNKNCGNKDCGKGCGEKHGEKGE